MAPGCELRPPTGSPEVWALPCSAKCCSLHNCAETRSQLPFSWYFTHVTSSLEWVLASVPAEYKDKKGRDCLLSLTLMGSLHSRFICRLPGHQPEGPKASPWLRGDVLSLFPTSCPVPAELMPTWLNHLLAPVFCPKVLNLVITPLLPPQLSVRNKYF